MEKNFSLFWGLSIQLYEATLVSDDSPFDQFVASPGNPLALSAAAQDGLTTFMEKGRCVLCHRGAEFTGAATSQLISGKRPTPASSST